MGASISIGMFEVGEAIRLSADLLANTDKLNELWTRADENRNGFVTLAEFEKIISESDEDDSPLFGSLTNKAAMGRAYYSTCGGGNSDEWIERREFPALLRNLIYFNKLWTMYEGIDTNKDRRLDIEELKAGMAKMKLEGVEASAIETHFSKMDKDGDGTVLFDDWVKYFASCFHPLADDLDEKMFDWDSKPSPRKMIHRIRPKPNMDGHARKPDPDAEFAAPKFEQVQQSFRELMTEKDEMRALWDSLDYRDSGHVSLTQVHKFFEQDPEFQILANQPALLRAYKRTALKGGNGDERVQWREFPALLRNTIVFNKLWTAFDDIDTSDDRRIDFTEFCRGCSQLGLAMDVSQCENVFDEIDSNDNGEILFDEFCLWYGKKCIPVE